MGVKRLWILALVVIVLGVTCTPSLAQGGDPDAEALVARYGPAMLPGFTGDLAAEHAGRPHYTLDVTLAVGGRIVSFLGIESVQLTNTSPDEWDRVVFRLYPNLASYGGSMWVSSITVDGAAATPVLDETGTILDVLLPDPLPPGEAVVIDMTFQTTITVGAEQLYGQFAYVDGIVAAPNFYPVLSVYQSGAGWWRETGHPQGDAVFSETAFFDVLLTAPADLLIATSGVALSRTEESGLAVYDIVAPLMRDFALMASSEFNIVSEDVDGVTVNVYSVEGDAIARRGLEIAVESVRVFDEAFGAYPFAELDVVETPTLAGGIEYPGLIVIAEQVWTPGTPTFTSVIAHEVAHQWWYSLVGNDQMMQPWLDESLTQYATALYWRATQGPRSEQDFLGYYEEQLEGVLGGPNDLPIGLPTTAYTATPEQYYYMVYAKGPLFFAALEDTVGSATMEAMLRAYFEAYRYEIAIPADMLNTFEDAAGQDFDALFAEWVGDVAGS
ncbi:MAG: M1 family metallopeptidase [Anaerolineae bacterium]|nr:M1 family metallopeptidase [Anaerolineae bacterium]